MTPFMRQALVMSFAAAVALLAVCGCNSPKPATASYIYTNAISDGLNHQISVNGKEEPFVPSDDSDAMALWSLCHLRSEIMDAGKNEIIVTGTIVKRVPKVPNLPPPPDGQLQDAQKAEDHLVFRLTGWKLRAPFHEANFYHENFPDPWPTKLRQTLLRSDFEKSKNFDPVQPGFDPEAYVLRSKTVK